MRKTKDIKEIEESWIEVLPVKNVVLFPGIMMPIAISRKSSLRMVKSALAEKKPLIVLTQIDESVNEPTGDGDLYTLGTYAQVLQIIPMPELGEGHVMAIFEGVHRVQVVDFQKESNSPLLANVKVCIEEMPKTGDKQFEATVDSIRDLVLQLFSNKENPSVDAGMTIRSISSTPSLVNYV